MLYHYRLVVNMNRLCPACEYINKWCTDVYIKRRSWMGWGDVLSIFFQNIWFSENLIRNSANKYSTILPIKKIKRYDALNTYSLVWKLKKKRFVFFPVSCNEENFGQVHICIYNPFQFRFFDSVHSSEYQTTQLFLYVLKNRFRSNEETFQTRYIHKWPNCMIKNIKKYISC